MIFKQSWSAENLTRADGLFPAEVPGNVQYDYARHIGLPDYQVADHSKLFEAFEDDTWRYQTALSYEKQPGETVWFHAGGIDYRCEIALNGEVLFTHEGSFAPLDVELTRRLVPDGENLLTVTIFPHPKRKGAPVSRSQADECAKAPVCYGWAWHPRLLVSGLWQDAYVETRPQYALRDVSVSYELSEDFKSADVTVDHSCEEEAAVTLTAPDGTVVYEGNERRFRLDQVELWWCNGQGKQALYTWRVKTAHDEKSGRIGFKRGKLVMNAGAWSRPSQYPMSRSDAPATFELNGRRIFLQGSNFLTPDIFTGRVTAETLRRQIELARDAHMNVFRCWGGCGCQKDEFYDLCDEYGILVWVEFPLACNNYSEKRPYLAVLEAEAEAIVKRLREHPSVAFWCGGNELFNGWSGMTDQHPALRLLNSVCYRLDPARPFLATSPLTGMGHGNYLFFDKTTGLDAFATFRNVRMTAYTEFGPPSLGVKSTVDKVIPEEKRVFPIPRDDPDWTAHFGTANTPQRCQDDLRVCFPECRELEDALDKSMLMQSMAYKSIFEEARRQWPQCAMAVNWCYNEPWYSVYNRNIIDYDSKPLPSYFAVRDSLRPVLATAGIPKFIWRAGEVFTADIWLHNDTSEAVTKTVRAELSICRDGEKPGEAGAVELLCWKGKCLPRENSPAPTVRFRLPNVRGAMYLDLALTLDDGTVNRYRLRYFEKPNAPAVRTLNEAIE